MSEEATRSAHDDAALEIFNRVVLGSNSEGQAAIREILQKYFPEAATETALETAVRFGGIGGEHHKAWVIDQMVRALAGDRYAQIVADAKHGEDGPETYHWDEGIAP